MLDSPTVEAYLEGQEESEEELVSLVQSTARVAKHFKCKIVNDVFNTLAWNG